MLLGVFGAALFYGDSMITPAISVLSAVEGLQRAFDGIETWVVPLPVVVLVGLFLIQKHGTARLGVLFGPIMVLWFTVLGALGIYGILQRPEVLQALNPFWAVNFFAANPGIGITILGAVVLALTKTPRWFAIPMLLGFLLVDILFFSANAAKILQGGAFPVVAGIVLFILMTTWKKGRRIVLERLDETSLQLPAFIDSIRAQSPHRVRGTAVFLTAKADGVPYALLHNQVLHERVVLLTVVLEDTPRVSPARRFEIHAQGEGFYRVSLHFGFIEEPDVPAALKLCQLPDLRFDPMKTTFFVSRETVISTRRTGMSRWREGLFSILLKNANGNLKYFKLPLNRVIELGTQVEM